MAVDDLDTLRQHLPDLFRDVPLPPGWEEDWHFIPVEDPERISLAEIEGVVEPFDLFDLPLARVTPEESLDWPKVGGLPVFGDRVAFPGSLVLSGGGSPYPPPDAFAFYLPFHYYHPTWWGIYLLLEPSMALAQFVWRLAHGVLSVAEAFSTVRLFLYAHESFHHEVESFATRLEITHRKPLYRTGFEQLYREFLGTDDCYEEALASAFAYRTVRKKLLALGAEKSSAALEALAIYIKGCPPGYRRALEFVTQAAFSRTRKNFAEKNQQKALPDIKPSHPDIWLSFSQAFRGISNVKSRVNYLVRRDSPLAKREQLHLRYLRYRELAKKLRILAHCEPVGDGKGSHEKWRNPKGQKFPVPRHPGDLRPGTLKAIIKQAGLQMSISEFLSA